MSGLTLIVLAYVLLTVFAVALVVRSVRIARMPTHLRWELAPVPKERDRGRYGGSYLEVFEWWTKPRDESLAQELSYLLQEVLLLKALREHNRRLWWSSYPFHLGLYLLIAAGALVALVELVSGPEAGASVRAVIDVTAGAAFGLGTLGALGLLANRLLDPALRQMATTGRFVNLLSVLAVFATGAVALATVDDFAGGVLSFAWALLTVGVPDAVPPALAAHFVATLVFLAYLPFTQMTHFVAKYFTYHQVRWDDRPLEAGGDLEAEMAELLHESPTWAAPHVGADGKKTWAEVASEDGR